MAVQMNLYKTVKALKLAEEVAEFARNNCLGMNWSTELADEALAAIREALADLRAPRVIENRSTWTNRTVYECSACGETFKSGHYALHHCTNECTADTLKYNMLYL